MNRARHSSKEIEMAIQYAEVHGWRYKAVGNSAHAWGRLLCPLQSREGCIISVCSTPRNAGIHAAQIKRRIDKCPHYIGQTKWKH